MIVYDGRSMERSGSLKRWVWVKALKKMRVSGGFWATIVTNPRTLTYTHSVHVSSTSSYWQGRSPYLRRPWDQVMLRKRISGNWILLASAQEFSLQWSWVWCARNASSIGRRGIQRDAVQLLSKLAPSFVICTLMDMINIHTRCKIKYMNVDPIPPPPPPYH